MAKRRKSQKRGRRGRSGGGSAVSRTVTPRQKEILRLVAQGLTNREIAHTLKISVRTVEVHRFNLMRRLKVRNVAQLLRQALLLRLLPKSFMTR
ncbi:MAG: LuxR C-terminal-related transcriptional regulator [Nitrospirales bacterium]